MSNDQDSDVSETSETQPPEKKYDPETITDYVNKHAGISRTRLNIQAFIGIFIFGWLMKINYDHLGMKGLGWAFLIAMALVFAIGRQVEPMIFAVGLVIYVAAWVHTNVLLTNKQRIAREQFFKENP